MNTKRLWVGVVASMLGVAGCGGGSGSNAFDVLSAAESDAIASVCECFALNDFTSAAECEAEFGEARTAEEIACAQEVYEANEAALQAETDCLLEAFSDAESCFNAVNACDETAHSACFEAVNVAIEACPEPAASVEAALDACDGGPPPV
jgi:hypothetical protein